MLEMFLNHLTRKLPEKYKDTYKRNFYNNLYFGSKWSFFRFISLAIFSLLIGASLVAVVIGLKSWWYPLILFLILLAIHFLTAIEWTVIQNAYMWKNEVIIPKRYNKIALTIAFVLFALTIYLLYKYAQRY